MKCLGSQKIGIRPGGYGMTFLALGCVAGSPRRFLQIWETRTVDQAHACVMIRASRDPNHTVPYGTVLLAHAIQAFHTWLPSQSPYGTKAMTRRRLIRSGRVLMTDSHGWVRRTNSLDLNDR